MVAGNTQDLTQGNLSRHLVHLAVPLVFGNILQEFYNTIDAFVVGRFAGQEEFAAIGVAGTVMNLFLFALVCFGYLHRTHRELLLQRVDFRLETARLRTTLKFGLVSSLHQCSLYLGKMFVQGAVNTAGTEIIAAYTAGTRIEGFANSIGSSGSTATSILTAQNYGAGREDRVEKTFRTSLCGLAALGVLAGLVMFLSAPCAISLLLGTGEGTAFSAAAAYLRLVSLFYPFCFTGNTFTGHYSGTGKVMLPFIGALGHISIRVIFSWMLFPYLGLNAVAFATGLGWLCGNVFWAFCKAWLDRHDS